MALRPDPCPRCGEISMPSLARGHENAACPVCGTKAEGASAWHPSSRFLLAAVLAPGLAAGPALWLLDGGSGGLGDLLLFTVMILPFALVASVLGGLPLHLVFSGRGIDGAGPYLVSGAGLGLVLGCVAAEGLGFFPAMVFVGVLCALLFWTFAVVAPRAIQ